MNRLILASASPQRKQLLAGLGVVFEIIPSSVDEPNHPELSPAKRAQELASLKAWDIAKKHPGCWVIGCDTLVEASDGTLFEKPIDADDARRMLRMHADSISLVHSALSVIDPSGKEWKGIDTSKVHFSSINTEKIEWWIATNQWQDRSGGFQIDGLGQLLIDHIEGDWTAIVGLPVYLLGELLEKAGTSITAFQS